MRGDGQLLSFTPTCVVHYGTFVIECLNHNAGAVTALATIALLLVTGWYAWTTRALLMEAQQSRFIANEPRIVAYLRTHEVHTNIVQLCKVPITDGRALRRSNA